MKLDLESGEYGENNDEETHEQQEVIQGHLFEGPAPCCY